MKIGIISDSHDHIEKLDKALELIKNEGCEALIHCGDISAPFILEELKKFPGRIFAILGNVGDPHGSSNKAKDLGIVFDNDSLSFELDKKRIAVVHPPERAKIIQKSGNYDLVCYGHTHIADLQQIGNSWIINPGEIMGRKGKHTFVIYDTVTNYAELFDFE